LPKKVGNDDGKHSYRLVYRLVLHRTIKTAVRGLHNGWRICGEQMLTYQKVTGPRSARQNCESAKCACYVD
jgi:hypothetical protein